MVKTSKIVLLAVAGVLLLLGLLSFVLQPGPPPAECAAAGAPTSGFVDSSQNCATTIDSYNDIREYETSPKLFRIAGLGLMVIGVVVGVIGVIGIVRRSRGETDASRAA